MTNNNSSSSSSTDGGGGSVNNSRSIRNQNNTLFLSGNKSKIFSYEI
jgi:hypothetical protein